MSHYIGTWALGALCITCENQAKDSFVDPDTKVGEASCREKIHYYKGLGLRGLNN